ncbi:AMP-dependent synthetase/ligase [Pararhodobacter zhoushanensis]|uniref:Long-chain fatty acid--CoA ligase n=1 Tax=Pararhodobacter zhoushanensis TaxID=2479545 RepID=A0ABT3GUF8_9RHOB|nr:long-chain fatty acid--CoA ligase [Pararhodobacter zhoushanensis]MCW1931156.1 long-chain fatty acid--CoA ligase [Pararhodobacter zhoushanensis]
MNAQPEKDLKGVRVNAEPGISPMRIDGHTTIPALLRARCHENGALTAHREKDLGIWQAYSWDDYLTNAQDIATGLRSLGLQRGEVISILAEDSKEWMYCDMAAQCLGAVSSGVYTTDSASQLAYLVTDSQTRFLFVENEEQLDKFLEVEAQMPSLIKVIIFDGEGLHDFHHDKCMLLSDLYDLGRTNRDDALFNATIDAVKPDDVAVLIYTSGTTGQPKGVMLTQENIMAAMEASLYGLPFQKHAEQLCFLPLCHILERVVSLYTPLVVSSTVNFAESPETVFDNLREISPHGFVAVPRVWEKIYSRVLVMAQDSTLLGRWAFSRAIKAGQARAAYLLDGRDVPGGVALRYRVWDFLVLANLRRMLGMDRITRGLTGAAPISPELLRWYHAIGVPLYEGFGMSETAGVGTINLPEANRTGSVGRPNPGVDVRIAPDGEIQVKGLNVFKGYLNKPDKTAEAFTEDGWLRTGDVGRIGDGFTTITGRMKDIIITAGGKNITPAEIESRLKFSHYISDAVVIGDRRKYLTCLIMIDQENVEKYAQDQKVPFSDFRSLCRAEPVLALIRAEVDAVNKEFARVEQIKDFRLIDVLLTAEDEELTATMKLKRATVETRHKPLIDAMY